MSRLSLLVLSALCLAVAGPAASAQDKYPSRPIKVLVPFGPGGSTDVVIRVVGEQLRSILGQSVVVENRPGALGSIAIEEAARANPDGYTLLMGNNSTNAIAPALFPKKFSNDLAKALVPVARLADLQALLVATTRNFSPKTFSEFVQYAKQNPGKILYSSAGVGSFGHFDMVIFARKAGLDMVHIPNKSGAAGTLNDLVVGDVHVAFINVTNVAGLVKEGRLRSLTTTSDQRLADFPDLPTMAESGYPDVGTAQWQALFAPAGTPPQVLDVLHKAILQALKTEPVQSTFKKLAIRAVPTSSPDDARVWWHSDLAKWREIVAETKISVAD